MAEDGEVLGIQGIFSQSFEVVLDPLKAGIGWPTFSKTSVPKDLSANVRSREVCSPGSLGGLRDNMNLHWDEVDGVPTVCTITAVLLDAEKRDFFLTARESMLGLALGRATDAGKPLNHERRVIARLRAEAATLD